MLQCWFPLCEAEYDTDIVHWTHGILMECYIFMTNGLLDLEQYITIWNHWLRVRVSVVQVCCINHKGISKHYWGFWTLSPTQPGNHKVHNLFRSLEWTHQCARVGDIQGLRSSIVWNKPCTNLNGVMMELKSSMWETTIPRGTKGSSQVVQGTHQWC